MPVYKISYTIAAPTLLQAVKQLPVYIYNLVPTVEVDGEEINADYLFPLTK